MANKQQANLNYVNISQAKALMLDGNNTENVKETNMIEELSEVSKIISFAKSERNSVLAQKAAQFPSLRFGHIDLGGAKAQDLLC